MLVCVTNDILIQTSIIFNTQMIKLSTFCTKSSFLFSCFLPFILYTLANFFNFLKVYVFQFCSIRRQQDEHLKSLLLNVLKPF